MTAKNEMMEAPDSTVEVPESVVRGDIARVVVGMVRRPNYVEFEGGAARFDVSGIRGRVEVTLDSNGQVLNVVGSHAASRNKPTLTPDQRRQKRKKRKRCK